jgi:hypothetical protein
VYWDVEKATVGSWGVKTSDKFVFPSFFKKNSKDLTRFDANTRQNTKNNPLIEAGSTPIDLQRKNVSGRKLFQLFFLVCVFSAEYSQKLDSSVKMQVSGAYTPTEKVKIHFLPIS